MCGIIKSLLKCGIQLIIIIINLLVLLSGILLLVFGSLLLHNAKNYDPSGEEGVTTEPSVIIALGTITVLGALLTIIGFCGCCGALCGNPCMLKTYAIIQLIIFIGVAAGLVFVLIWDEDEFTDEWQRQVKYEYGKLDSTGTVTVLTLSWDARMTTFQCCGSDSYKDWRNSYYENNSNFSVPVTCCKLDSPGNYTNLEECRAEAEDPVLDEDNAKYLNARGCDYLVSKSEIAIIVICSILLAFQLVSVILACIIVSSKSKTDAVA